MWFTTTKVKLCPALTVEFFVDVAEVFVSDVGIDLGGLDIGMAKEGLYGAQVRAVL